MLITWLSGRLSESISKSNNTENICKYFHATLWSCHKQWICISSKKAKYASKKKVNTPHRNRHNLYQKLHSRYFRKNFVKSTEYYLRLEMIMMSCLQYLTSTMPSMVTPIITPLIDSRILHMSVLVWIMVVMIGISLLNNVYGLNY